MDECPIRSLTISICGKGYFHRITKPKFLVESRFSMRITIRKGLEIRKP